MSTRTGQKLDQEEEVKTYLPKTAIKSVVIQRGSFPGKGRSSMGGFSSYSSRQSMGGMINPQVYNKISKTGISSFCETREAEKRNMQQLNERFASYIEKVRLLEMQNRKQEAELEALRKRKTEDWRPIREQYEVELDQCRKVIAELSTDKGVSEARLANMQDEIASLKDLIHTYDTHAKDYAKKIDQLNSQIGEYEGELNTLRLRVGSLEDENAKLRELNAKLRDENARLRGDLDSETAAHIQCEVDAQNRAEEVEFLKELLDKLELLKQEPVTIGGQDLATYFKNELRASVRELQNAYENQFDIMRNEMESKYSSQMDQLRSGNVRDNLEVEHAREETKKLREQIGEYKRRIAELEAALGTARSERDGIMIELEEKSRAYEDLETQTSARILDLSTQVDGLFMQLQELIDAKMSLELEIACYKKLLEGEENRTGLRQLVEQTVGARSGGLGGLADLVQQSSMGSSTARTLVQRSSKGPICVQEVDQAGRFITIENTSSGSRSMNQPLKGWKLIRESGNKTTHTVKLPDFLLRSGGTFTVWARGAKPESDNDNEMVVDAFTMGTGTCKWQLVDESNSEKATVSVKVVTQ